MYGNKNKKYMLISGYLVCMHNVGKLNYSSTFFVFKFITYNIIKMY